MTHQPARKVINPKAAEGCRNAHHSVLRGGGGIGTKILQSSTKFPPLIREQGSVAVKLSGGGPTGSDGGNDLLCNLLENIFHWVGEDNSVRKLREYYKSSEEKSGSVALRPVEEILPLYRI